MVHATNNIQIDGQITLSSDFTLWIPNLKKRRRKIKIKGHTLMEQPFPTT